MSRAPKASVADETTVKKGGWRAWLHERLGLDVFYRLAAAKDVPIHSCSHFYFLGGMALFLFLIQILSGALLSLYYTPSPEHAFESVQTLMTEVDFGWLIRSAHAWSANLAIGILFLHMLTTYMMRAYRRPREFTWASGVVLLSLFMAFGFSGYLLPWNQLAFFATRVGTALVGVVPLIGEDLLRLARGGEDVTGQTLSRFYALHVAILPMATLGVLGMHLFLVQHHGMSVPEREARRRPGQRGASMKFFPDFLLRDSVGWYLALAMLAALSALFPWELGEKADPFAPAPEGIKPEWYFLFMFQTLKQLPGHVLGMEGEMLGALFFALAGLLVLLTPLLDRGPKSRLTLNVLVALAVAYFICMTAWGYFESNGRRLILGASLALGIVLLAAPLSAPQGAWRKAVWALAAVAAGGLAVGLVWEIGK